MSASCNIGDHVRFALADVFLPGPELAGSLGAEVTELDGTLIEFSDSGNRPKAFAVIEVVRKQLMVVPIEKLELVAGPPLYGAGLDQRQL